MKKKQKIIFDLVHSYIRISKNVEIVINDDIFQRLKHIRQTTSYHLYPSTNHTRFEHSLGVMKLAKDFFNNLKKQFMQCYIDDNLDEKRINEIMSINYYHLIFASLLHDIGHSPFSHLFEDFYSEGCIKDNIQKRLDELNLQKRDFNVFKKGNLHEWMSCLVIGTNLYNKLNEIFSKMEIDFDIEYISRIITGNKYLIADNPEYWDRNLIISIVNSDTIDVDKLDYLMRDNFMSGMVGPNIDIDRLLHSLVITKRRKLGFTKVGISTIQKIIECRDSIYLWLCNHHAVVYTDYLLYETIDHMSKLFQFSDTVDKPPEYINVNRKNSKIVDLLQYYDEHDMGRGTLKLKNDISSIDKKSCIKYLKKIGYLPYKEAFNQEEYFSIDAILNRQITDNEVFGLINHAKYLFKRNELSAITERLIEQLINRNFLKPLWKTLYQFKNFIDQKFLMSDAEKEEIIQEITNNKTIRRNIVSIICKETNCKKGEIFLIVKKNKFYLSPELSKILIFSYDKENKEYFASINKLLPQRDYKSMYEDVAFYIFCKEDKKDEVTKIFVEIVNDFERLNIRLNNIK